VGSELASVIGTGVAAIVGVGLGGWLSTRSLMALERMQYGHRRGEQDASSQLELIAARRAAYRRYLVAQQAMAPLLKTISRSALPPEEARGEHFDGRDAPEYIESGAAEMDAILLAGTDVRAAIKGFEKFIEDVIDRSHASQSEYSAWSHEWESKRNDLVNVMADELEVGFARIRSPL